MSSEPTRPSFSPAARHRHPATWLVTGIIFVSYVGLNLWSPDGRHGFPSAWMTRSIPFSLRAEQYESGPAGKAGKAYSPWSDQIASPEPPQSRVTWARVRAALPLEWFVGDFSRVSAFSIPKFVVAVFFGVCFVYFPFQWFDWFFGRRALPFYRFGLLRLMIGVSAFAVFFALTNESRTLFIAKVIVVLAVPAAWLGISTWVVRRERAMARELVRRRRERREEEALAMEEIELN